MKTIKTAMFLLVCTSVAHAFPLYYQSVFGYGRFSDTNEGKGAIYHFETGFQAGKSLFSGIGLIAEYGSYNRFPGGMMIPEYRVMNERKQQYAYGGSIGIGLGEHLGPHVVYRFKQVRTYHETIFEDFINAPGQSFTENEYKQQPAYDIVFGVHGTIPKTPAYIAFDWAHSRIWNTYRINVMFSAGIKFGIGDINIKSK